MWFADEPENTTNGSTTQNKSTTGPSGSAGFAKSTGTATTSEETPDHPSTNLKANDVPEDTSKGQNDVRAPEDPQTNPKSAPTDVDNTGDGPNEAQKLEGAGPKPIEEVAKEHGGDAGQNKSTGSVNDTSSGVTKTSSKDDAGDEDGPNAKSKGEGTGEKYVKSSGLKADGGDFDVSQPGAGREADRKF